MKDSIVTAKTVIEFGNSQGVTLTKEFRKLGVKPGDLVVITVTPFRRDEE